MELVHSEKLLQEALHGSGKERELETRLNNVYHRFHSKMRLSGSWSQISRRELESKKSGQQVVFVMQK